MKREIQFECTDDAYCCSENGKKIFTILKKDLQFNVKDFYQAFYADDKDFDDIQIVTVVDDKDAKRICGCIKSLIEQISEKLKELPTDTDNQSSE
jgi:hypothetical protein